MMNKLFISIIGLVLFKSMFACQEREDLRSRITFLCAGQVNPIIRSIGPDAQRRIAELARTYYQNIAIVNKYFNPLDVRIVRMFGDRGDFDRRLEIEIPGNNRYAIVQLPIAHVKISILGHPSPQTVVYHQMPMDEVYHYGGKYFNDDELHDLQVIEIGLHKMILHYLDGRVIKPRDLLPF